MDTNRTHPPVDVTVHSTDGSNQPVEINVLTDTDCPDIGLVINAATTLQDPLLDLAAAIALRDALTAAIEFQTANTEGPR